MEVFGVPAANLAIARPVGFKPIDKLLEFAGQGDDGRGCCDRRGVCSA
jgi:hypothetical protein